MKVEKNLPVSAFISLSANVITRIFSVTLLRTLNTPSGKEMSLQLDRSAEKKKIYMSVIMGLSRINTAGWWCWIPIINKHWDLKSWLASVSLCHHLLVIFGHSIRKYRLSNSFTLLQSAEWRSKRWKMCKGSLTQSVFGLLYSGINPPGHICNCLSHFSAVSVPMKSHTTFTLPHFLWWHSRRPSNVIRNTDGSDACGDFRVCVLHIISDNKVDVT